MKRILILLFLFRSLATNASALDETEVADGWFYYTDTKTRGDDTYSIQGINTHLEDENESLVRIKKNDDTKVLIPFGQCITTDDYKYCYEDRDFSDGKILIDDYGRLQPEIKILIIEYTEVTDLDLERTFEQTSFNLQETGRVTITATNEGDVTLYNIRLTEVIPEQFQISFKESAYTQTGNTLKSTFTLFPGSTWTKSYDLKATAYGEAEYETEILYDTETSSDKIATTKMTTLEVPSPYEVEYTSFDKAVDVKDKVSYTVTIENLDDQTMLIDNFEIVAPPGLSFITSTGLSSSQPYHYGYSGEVNVGKSKTLTISGFVPIEKTYEFSHSGTVRVKGDLFDFDGSSSVEAVTTGLNCFFDFDNLEATASQVIEFDANLHNNDDLVFYTVEGKIVTPFGDKTFSMDTISPDEKIVLFEKEVLLPFSLDDTSYNFSVNGTYRSENNQFFNFDCAQEYIVGKAEKLLEIRTSPNTTNATRGETVSIPVVIQNVLNIQIDNIDVKEEGRSEFAHIDYLLGNRNKTAYTITFQIPEDTTQEKLTFTSIVKVKDMNYEDTVVTEILVFDANDPIPTNTNNNNSSNTTTNDNNEGDSNDNNNQIPIEGNDEKKKSFFAKIGEFFSSLFGKN